MKQKFYSYKNIDAKNAQYNLIIGERSNGKTYGALLKILQNYVKTGKQGAIIRRWSDDFTGKRGASMFDALVSNKEVEKLTAGEWTNIYYWGGRWYLSRFDKQNRRENSDTPIAYGFSLSAMEHDKSISYPDITTVVFDEFLTRSMYLQDEFILFENVLSTIIRHRTDVKIYMLGNTVNKYCPYFTEMGLRHIKDQKQGTIDVYQYGDSNLTVAVEYCATNKTGKDSDIYFAFDNPALSTIKTGSWEIDIYAHCPCKYTPKNIKFIYFICFDDYILQCEIVRVDNKDFTFIHPKTSPLKDTENDLIYDTEYHPEPNYRRKINKPVLPVEKKIYSYFQTEKVFYSDNETGEIVRNYLQFCNS